MTKTSLLRPLLATAAALALALPIASFASDPTPAPAQPADKAATSPAAEKSAEPTASPTLDAAKVAVDPKTGERRELTASEDAALRTQMQAFLAQFASIPHQVKHDRHNGRYSYLAAPTQLRMAIAVVGPDGKPVWDCAGQNVDPALFAAELAAKAAAAQKEEQ